MSLASNSNSTSGCNSTTPRYSPILEKNWLWGVGNAVLVMGTLIYTLTAISFFYQIALFSLWTCMLLELITEVQSTKLAAGQVVMVSETAPYLTLLTYLSFICRQPIGILAITFSLQSIIKAFYCARAHPQLASYSLWRDYLQPLGHHTVTSAPYLLQISLLLELVALPWLIINVFSVGIMPIFIYVAFLRWQYSVNPKIREKIRDIDQKLVAFSETPSCPKWFRRVYGRVQHTVKQFAKVTVPEHVNKPRPSARPVSR